MDHYVSTAGPDTVPVRMTLLHDTTVIEPSCNAHNELNHHRVRRYVKPQSSQQENTLRISGMNHTAIDAFNLAAEYTASLVMGQVPTAIEHFAPKRDASFYTAMAIGVRHYTQVSEWATGTE